MRKPIPTSDLPAFGRLTLLVGIALALQSCPRSALEFSEKSSVTATNFSQSGVTAQGSCNNASLLPVYQAGYYNFLRTNKCALCHGGSGPGPSIAAADVQQAFSIFQTAPNQYLASILDANAVDPNHHGAGSPANESTISGISSTWKAALSTFCSTSANSTSSNSYTYNYVLKTQAISLAPGGSAVLTWKLDADVSPPAPASVPVGGSILTATITASAAGAVQTGYYFSKILITTAASGIRVTGAKVVVNGSIYEDGSTFVNSVADMPAQVTDFPLSIGAVFIPMAISAGDTFTLKLGKFELPTIAQNYQFAPAPAPTFSNPAKFSELASPGGPFVKYCAQCHNPIFRNGNLNILDYDNVMNFVSPGDTLYNGTHSALIYLITVGGANVMPPAGKLPYTTDNFLYFPVKSWFDNGAPND